MDLFGPSRTSSFCGKYYCLVIVDDYSKFTWVIFFATKDEAFPLFTRLAKKVQNEKNYVITYIRSDNGRELDNHKFESYCDEHGIGHNFSAPRTPRQNGVVERKNKTLEKMARENSLIVH